MLGTVHTHCRKQSLPKRSCNLNRQREEEQYINKGIRIRTDTCHQFQIACRLFQACEGQGKANGTKCVQFYTHSGAACYLDKMCGIFKSAQPNYGVIDFSAESALVHVCTVQRPGQKGGGWEKQLSGRDTMHKTEGNMIISFPDRLSGCTLGDLCRTECPRTMPHELSKISLPVPTLLPLSPSGSLEETNSREPVTQPRLAYSLSARSQHQTT